MGHHDFAQTDMFHILLILEQHSCLKECSPNPIPTHNLPIKSEGK